MQCQKNVKTLNFLGQNVKIFRSKSGCPNNNQHTVHYNFFNYIKITLLKKTLTTINNNHIRNL